MEKRGAAGIITTVLIIGVAIVAIVIIYNVVIIVVNRSAERVEIGVGDFIETLSSSQSTELSLVLVGSSPENNNNITIQLSDEVEEINPDNLLIDIQNCAQGDLNKKFMMGETPKLIGNEITFTLRDDISLIDETTWNDISDKDSWDSYVEITLKGVSECSDDSWCNNIEGGIMIKLPCRPCSVSCSI
tara:strand:+ start:66 stop:629 length:564 start_codon:yes stop_codon:yes gene_type:complete